jgi:hypothetical protein
MIIEDLLLGMKDIVFATGMGKIIWPIAKSELLVIELPLI